LASLNFKLVMVVGAMGDNEADEVRQLSRRTEGILEDPRHHYWKHQHEKEE